MKMRTAVDSSDLVLRELSFASLTELSIALLVDKAMSYRVSVRPAEDFVFFSRKISFRLEKKIAETGKSASDRSPSALIEQREKLLTD